MFKLRFAGALTALVATSLACGAMMGCSAAAAGEESVAGPSGAALTAASIPGPLHFGGSLPVPSTSAFTGRDPGNHPAHLTVTIGTGAFFGADWTITASATEYWGETDTFSFDLATGAVDLGSLGHDGSQSHKVTAPPSAGADVTEYLAVLNPIQATLTTLVSGRPANGPYAEAPIAELQTYLTYVTSVIAQVRSASTPLPTTPAVANIPASFLYGGTLPLPAQPSYTGRGPGNHYATYTVTIANNAAPFTSDWSISVQVSQDDGAADSFTFDLQSGLLDHRSSNINPNVPSSDEQSSYQTSPGGSTAPFLSGLQEMQGVLQTLVDGRPPSQPYAEDPIPALQPYLTYINGVIAKPTP